MINAIRVTDDKENGKSFIQLEVVQDGKIFRISGILGDPDALIAMLNRVSAEIAWRKTQKAD